ncbi:DMT family transporter [Luteimonas terrae]|uniref:Drug/metabolite transporter (DMT)-like permease n=1 Tax=Luteimonas terrae TaxID=1530191 RepID=A0ABU1XTS5_9GAMM|nr:DMT family transporter [Luteimonas terrae]MDR7192143.1 drug/metabolite transporter (DMT)-like permease [Luteimonas terrae]
MHDVPSGRVALAWMLTGAALIGTNGLMVRLAGTAPTVSAFYRMLFAGVLLTLFVHLRRDWRPMPRRMWWLALLPATAFAADLWLWHRSILLIGPGLATLLANAQVFFMALAGVVLFGERVGLRFVAGIALAFFGL